MKSKFKQLETLFAWSEFYANSKNLAVPTNPDKIKLEKIKSQVNKLRSQLID